MDPTHQRGRPDTAHLFNFENFWIRANVGERLFRKAAAKCVDDIIIMDYAALVVELRLHPVVEQASFVYAVLHVHNVASLLVNSGHRYANVDWT